MDEGGKDTGRRRDERDTREDAMLRATGRDNYRNAQAPTRERPANLRRAERKPRRG